MDADAVCATWLRQRVGLCTDGKDGTTLDVDVWRVEVGDAAFRTAHLHDVLSLEERSQAARYLHEADRRRYVTMQSAARVILASHCGAAPSELQLERGAYGKPRLGGALADAGVEFNCSRSGDWIVVAVARGRAVGVDVERAVAADVARSIRGAVLARREERQVQGLPESARSAFFSRVWTRKEAVLKAIGVGLSLPMDAFEVGGETFAGSRMAGVPAAGDSVQHVAFADIELPTGYAGAVAACLEGA